MIENTSQLCHAKVSKQIYKLNYFKLNKNEVDNLIQEIANTIILNQSFNTFATKNYVSQFINNNDMRKELFNKLEKNNIVVYVKGKKTDQVINCSDEVMRFRLAFNSFKQEPEKIHAFKDFLHSQDLHSKAESEVIELTALLFIGIRQNPDLFNESMLSKFPDFAKKYYEVIKNLYNKSIDLEQAYKEIKKQTKVDDNTLLHAKAAHIINIMRVPIYKLKKMEGWNTLTLDYIAPHLRYFDLINLKKDDVAMFFNYSTNINSLEIDENCNLKELPPLPNCRFLRCDSGHVISFPKILPNCETFECSSYSGTLPEVPLCQNFRLTHCKATTLPELLLCQNFKLYRCNFVTSLPNLPACKAFYLSECNALAFSSKDLSNCETFECHNMNSAQTSFPDLSSCKTFKFFSSNTRAPLPKELLNCEIFICEQWSGLTALPEMPKCKIFRSLWCTKLKSFPTKLERCEEFKCNNSAISFLPELPLCKVVDCSKNSQLRGFSSLPMCRTLNCEKTPNLEEYPENLPACFKLICEGSPLSDRRPTLAGIRRETEGMTESDMDLRETIEVDIDDFQQKPKNYLAILATILEKKSHSKICYKKNGIISNGYDDGGLKRDFVSQLLTFIFDKASEADACHLKSFNYDSKEGLEPFARENEESEYRILGKLFARCFLGENYFTIGTIFRTSVFQSLLEMGKSCSDEAWVKVFLSFMMGEEQSLENIISRINSNLDPEKEEEAAKIACQLIESEMEKNPKTREECKNQKSIWSKLVIAAKNNGYLQAIFWMADAMKNELTHAEWEKMCQLNVVALQEKIQGKLSAKLLKEKIGYIPASDSIAKEDHLNIKTYFETWIDQQSVEQLSLFVEGVTGNKTLGPGNITINIYPTESYVPVARICHFYLDVSSKYKSQEDFNRAMERFLENFNTDSRFQLV